MKKCFAPLADVAELLTIDCNYGKSKNYKTITLYMLGAISALTLSACAQDSPNTSASAVGKSAETTTPTVTTTVTETHASPSATASATVASPVGLLNGNEPLDESAKIASSKKTRHAAQKESAQKIKPTAHTGYKNCTEARKAGVTPIRRGQPGYGGHLDRDGDGIACE